MISKDKKQIAIALPKEMIQIMEKSIEESRKKGHTITKSDIIITALGLLFGIAEEKLKQANTPKEEA